MSLPIHHVYILVSILIPVGCVCIFASYMMFVYDPERGWCCPNTVDVLPQWTSRSADKPMNPPSADQDVPQSVCIQHPDHRQMSVATKERDQDDITIVYE